ncbi:hypothetical protein [Actinoalloteichus caeruleus]|uniref:HD domain-containing protein n=1 Tax=Actinoalloteichus caeruleus DSM 43889 TaxID=1120930 RepID=A0ABT1JNR0_ACTCY|nr:hypothetical protein [Actinoalloteichus caeruleus]MCP2334165.1 hypothetical protein [Actinoalloteichus caeruleus DSM 43889]
MEQVRWAHGVARDRLATTAPGRWRHAQAVGVRAVQIADLYKPDHGLLVAAAVLHCIGYAPDLVDTGFPPVDGARHLRDLGAHPRLCGLVAHHGGAAVEAGLRGLADELAEFPDEPGPTRDALWYCELTVGPNGERRTFDQWIADIEARDPVGSVPRRFLELGRDQLRGAVDRTRERLSHVGLERWDPTVPESA